MNDLQKDWLPYYECRMSFFKDWLEDRKERNRNAKHARWSNFLIKLLLLAFVVYIMSKLGYVDSKTWFDFYNKAETEQVR